VTSSENTDVGGSQGALAVAQLYHSWLIGLVLSLIVGKGPKIASDFVFRLFRRQHLQKFLPGLQKLGLDGLPHAVAAAKYHYFSNQLGGVRVEYYEEHDRKAWIRYPPPRWIWAGPAICAIPKEVNYSMLHGWHAYNGISLNNPKLGFVCTKATVDGDAGLEGYYFEYEHELNKEERLRFAPDESCPYIDPETLPHLNEETWPEVRKAKACRNYAMEYIRVGLPLLLDLLGSDEGKRIGNICGLQIGMQCYDDVFHRLGMTGNDAITFMEVFEVLLRASGDIVVRKNNALERHSWRLFASANQGTLVDIWRAPFVGLLLAHNRFLELRHDEEDRFSVCEKPNQTVA